MTTAAPDSMHRVLVFGDDWGLPILLDHLPREHVVGVVGASIRPGQHGALGAIAARAGVPLLLQPLPSTADYAGFVADVRSLAPDLIIVCSYSMLLREEIRRISRHPPVNVHGGLLPKYRGANPTQWALIEDERETGVSMHVLTEEADAGDIIGEERVPIDFEETWVELRARIHSATHALIRRVLPEVLAQRARAQAQPFWPHGSRRRRRPEDGLIDWSSRVLDVYNLIRSLVAPHPGARYLTADGTQTALDRWASIGETACMKFGALGGRVFEHAGVRLTPIPAAAANPSPALAERAAANRTVEFDAMDTTAKGAKRRRVALREIDWVRREAAIAAGTPPVDAALTAFARGELGLTVLR